MVSFVILEYVFLFRLILVDSNKIYFSDNISVAFESLHSM